MSAGKGDKRRPQLVSNAQLEANWKKTFKKKEKNNDTKPVVNSTRVGSSGKSEPVRKSRL